MSGVTACIIPHFTPLFSFFNHLSPYLPHLPPPVPHWVLPLESCLSRRVESVMRKGHKKTLLLEGQMEPSEEQVRPLRSRRAFSHSPYWLLRSSQRLSMRSRSFELFFSLVPPLDLFENALAVPTAEKLEITVITPLSAMRKPTIPMGAFLLMTPAKTVTNPRIRRAAPLRILFFEGVSGDADNAETSRGSSVKRAASISSRRRFSRSDSGTCSE